LTIHSIRSRPTTRGEAFKTPEDKYGTPKDGFTVVCTTYRMTELYHYWTKEQPMNVQLVPERSWKFPWKWRKRWDRRRREGKSLQHPRSVHRESHGHERIKP